MSQIKSKDLTFNKQEPAFLRRIREANNSGGNGDRHERPIARPQRLRNQDQDEEDLPTYVDEDGASLSKADYDALVSASSGTQRPSTELGEDGNGLAGTTPEENVGGSVVGEVKGTEPKVSGAIRDEVRKSTVVDVGGLSKKRKVARVVGGEEGEGFEDGERELSTLR